MSDNIKELVRRLRGEYRIPITDGHGPAGGDEPDNAEEFVRHFPSPPIQKEAADALEALAGEVERLTKTHEHAAANAARYLGLLNDAEAEVVRLRGGS